MRVVDSEVKLKQQHPGESLLSTGRIPVGRPGSAAKMSVPHHDEEQRQEDEKHPPSLPHPHAAGPLRLQDAAVGDIEGDRGENQHYEALGEVRNGPYQRGVVVHAEQQDKDTQRAPPGHIPRRPPIQLSPAVRTSAA